jgi:hypothetical protein
MKISLIFLFIFFTTTIYSSNNPSKFFASNNTGEINIETAYKRLESITQHQLQNNMISIIQHNHLEQGKFTDILGTYRMSSDQQMTADNTEIFYSSPYQPLSTEQIFSSAQQLANALKQESVAVFIANDQTAIGNICVKFTTSQPTISQAINLLHNKLPDIYNQAFSLHLNYHPQNFNTAKVTKIEWLGNQIKLDEIKKAFPNDKIFSYSGKAYLVYKNGQVDPL